MNNKFVKVAENKTKDKEFWLPCLKCQSETVHRVMASLDSDGDDDIYCWHEQHQIIQCQGCRSFSFRYESSNSEDYTRVSEDDWEQEVIETLYPPRYTQRPQLPDSAWLPSKIKSIYDETHFTLCNRQLILTGIGIRALIESVCKDKNASGADLHKRIKDLVNSGNLKQGEADILQKLRIMGNKAAHEVKSDSERTLAKAFDIVEHLLINVYLLELRARQLPGK
jgi:Domain of unknown function (DUF4145)